jgi:hypothetical protein
MNDKDSKLIQEAYSKVYIKEEEDSSEYGSRLYNDERAQNTYAQTGWEFEFKYKLNEKDWVINSNIDYDVEDPGDDEAWEWHEFTVNSISYYNEETGEYVDVNEQQQPVLYKTLEDATAEVFQTDADNWM